jgi:methionyl-tRNA synthetase
VAQREAIAADFEGRNFQSAMRRVMLLADEANRYIDDAKPWQRIKLAGEEAAVHEICTQGINLFRVLMTYLAPVLPFTAARSGAFLGLELNHWQAVDQPLLGREINAFVPLLNRIDPVKVAAIIQDSSESLKGTPREAASAAPKIEPLAEEIGIEDFARIDLRIALITRAEAVPEADKLVKLTLDVGSETRTVFAGIKSAYDPSELEGRMTVMVANLKPRKMRFGASEGMVLAAGPGGSEVFILSPDSGATPGMRVK